MTEELEAFRKWIWEHQAAAVRFAEQCEDEDEREVYEARAGAFKQCSAELALVLIRIGKV